MAKSQGRLASINQALIDNGLKNFGAFQMDDDSIGLLIGNAGSQMWDVFSKSSQYQDDLPDPMNRWTRKTLSDLSLRIHCRAVFPFDKPFLPFQHYATLATGAKQSPLGLLIHPDYGLWHAFRGVLIFSDHHEIFSSLQTLIKSNNNTVHPCDTCVEKPCLRSCPVSAFSADGLNVTACFNHIDDTSEPDCLQVGCAARHACPIGSDFRYKPDQIKFHMQAYRGTV